MIIEFIDEKTGELVKIDKLRFSKNEKDLFSCKLITLIPEGPLQEDAESVLVEGKGFSINESFRAGLYELTKLSENNIRKETNTEETK